EDAPADALGCGDRSLAAGVENRAEDEIVDRRPARIGLRDRVDVDFARHCPRHANLRAVASLTRDGETHIRLAPDATPASRTGATRVAPTPLSINPPPSTRACPPAASYNTQAWPGDPPSSLSRRSTSTPWAPRLSQAGCGGRVERTLTNTSCQPAHRAWSMVSSPSQLTSRRRIRLVRS